MSEIYPHEVVLTDFPKLSTPQCHEPQAVINSWLTRFNDFLSTPDFSQLPTLIHSTAWWRDHVALSWDLRTLNGLPNITKYLTAQLPTSGLSDLRIASNTIIPPRVKSPLPGQEWIEAIISFDTKVGRGKGVIRLTQDNARTWKAYMIYTALQELRDHEEFTGKRRPHGGNNSLHSTSTISPNVQKGNWLDKRHHNSEFKSAEPAVVIIGAGQAGLNIAAHLRALGVTNLILDRNARVGDNWRQRYRTLVTHDPVRYTHMYGLPFPDTWPLYTPKDKLADWFEAYASIMELNIWMSSTVHGAEYDEDKGSWTVNVTCKDGTERTLKPRHIVFCTGHSGEAKIPTFAGQDLFGGMIYHGSQHTDASLQPNGVIDKRVVVVGTGNSGHDIAQNFYENGADVTMLQRSGTYVLRADTGGRILHQGMYDEDGPPTEEADIYGQSLPLPVQFALNVETTKRITEAEKEQLEGLKNAGFELDFGHDGSGIMRKYLSRGGGYYIDVGASQLLVERKIKVVRCEEGIERFEEDGLVLKNGKRLDTDIVVLATGYDNMRTTLRRVMGDQVADRAKDVWDLDEEGEMNAMWRPSGHPGLFFSGGNLALCRIYSRFLALQIKAIELGFSTYPT